MTYKLGSLFDGSGGFPLAGSLCGIEPVWAAEVEPYPVAVTRSRFPNMKHYGDVSKINGAEVEPVDIITFGAPCQDLSVAGKRKGLRHEELGDEETTRSGLFWEAVRIIKEMREATNGRYPAFAIYENVPGAFSSSGGEDWRTVLQSLIQIVEPGAVMPDVPKGGWSYADWYMGEGWSLAYRVFDAQYWGVPQRRRRIYLVADFRGERAGKILFEREGLRGYFAPGRTPWQAAAGDAEAGAGADDRAGDGIVAAGFKAGQSTGGIGWQEECAQTLSAKCSGTEPTVCVKEQHLFENHSQDTRYKGPLDVCPMLPAQLGTGGNNTPFVVEEREPVLYNGENITSPLNKTNPQPGDPCHTLGTDSRNWLVQPVYCIDGDKIGKAERSGGSGLGIREGDKMYSLTAKDAGTHAVAYSIGNGQLNQISMSETCNTLDCMHDKQAVLVDEPASFYPQMKAESQCFRQDGVANTIVNGTNPGFQNGVVISAPPRYIVRRLTPTECARLQGFPDAWGHPDHKDSFTDEEYSFWLDVRNTHAAINGKAVKEYTREQMLKWYNNLHTDSSEYKMWGNGIALPCALYVMQGIEDALKERALFEQD